MKFLTCPFPFRMASAKGNNPGFVKRCTLPHVNSAIWRKFHWTMMTIFRGHSVITIPINLGNANPHLVNLGINNRRWLHFLNCIGGFHDIKEAWAIR